MTASRQNNQLPFDFGQEPTFAARRRGEAVVERMQGVEAATAEGIIQAPTSDRLMELICDHANIEAAVRRVTANKGAAGVDRMSTRELPRYMRTHWPAIRDHLLEGTYRPNPVRSVAIDKPDGGVRMLGIPLR